MALNTHACLQHKLAVTPANQLAKPLLISIIVRHSALRAGEASTPQHSSGYRNWNI
jgi:hypothetical protein